MATVEEIDRRLREITHSKQYQLLITSQRDRYQEDQLAKIRLEMSSLTARRKLLAPEVEKTVHRRPVGVEIKKVNRALPPRSARPEPEKVPPTPIFVSRRPVGLTTEPKKQLPARTMQKPVVEMEEPKRVPRRAAKGMIRSLESTDSTDSMESLGGSSYEEPTEGMETLDVTLDMTDTAAMLRTDNMSIEEVMPEPPVPVVRNRRPKAGAAKKKTRGATEDEM
jgi:hypothetical protein